MQIHNTDFCKRSPNGRHNFEYIGDVKRGGKDYEFSTCSYCGADLYEPI